MAIRSGLSKPRGIVCETQIPARFPALNFAYASLKPAGKLVGVSLPR